MAGASRSVCLLGVAATLLTLLRIQERIRVVRSNKVPEAPGTTTLRPEGTPAMDIRNRNHKLGEDKDTWMFFNILCYKLPVSVLLFRIH